MNDAWEWELIAKHDSLTEGPTWDGSALLYNECYASISYRWDPKTKKSRGLANEHQPSQRDEIR